MKAIFIFALVAFSSQAFSQTYIDSLKHFRKNYIDTHEVVTGENRKNLQFHPITPEFRVMATVERLHDTAGFIMKTSGPKTPRYFRYGILHFNLFKKPLRLTIYQSENLMADTTYKDYLFVPFTDATSGELNYGGGRYLDFTISDIKDGLLFIDFNKSYNPYCAYAKGYNCPIPPAENYLDVPIIAGEANFAEKHP